MTLIKLAARWYQRTYDPWVTEEVKCAFRVCAQELEAALREEDNALLSPKEASAECGLHPATIRKKLSNGDWPNEGTPYRPKVRRRVLREAVAKQVATRLQVVR